MHGSVVLAVSVHHRGPGYFFVVGISLLVFFVPMVIAPNLMRRLNTWLAKSSLIRAMARARYGTDGTDQTATDTRIRVGCAVGAVVGAIFLIVGLVKATG